MSNRLQKARDFAENIRFSGDHLDAQEEILINLPDRVRGHFFGNELNIAKEVTPDLHASLARVLARLDLPEKMVEAFVYASPSINASCHAGQGDECIIRFSSALVDILEFEEFEFVVGHELGHFLLSHSCTLAEDTSKSLEHYMVKRAQELSADRIGLVAGVSLDAAITALIKTISGLSSGYLRFDVSKFLSQLSKSVDSPQPHYSTHPSILVRSRALLWFSMSESYKKGLRQYPKQELDKLNERIQRDLEKYVDGGARHAIEEAESNLSMWMAALEFVEDGVFTKDEQGLFEAQFGAVKLSKLKRYLSGMPKDKALALVKEKVANAQQELEALAPLSAAERFARR